MTAQATFDFEAPARATKPEKRPGDCHNLECSNRALPGKEMCRACAERFGAYLRGKIIGWRG